ncbi:MAG TPA: hypothetical protein VF735_15125 [Pyrinomonadaceae bacterium]|jgi:hypothetical protein
MTINEEIKPDIARELKWKEYTLHIDHYRYYLNISLQGNVFFYTVSGVVLGVYLKTPNDNFLEFLLLLPILLGASLGGIFIYGGNLWAKAYNNIENITEVLRKSGFEVERAPDIHLLRVFLKTFGYIFFGVGVLLILLPCLTWFQTYRRELPWYKAFPRELYIFVSIAVVFLLIGILIPHIANRIDKKLQGQRKQFQADK